MKISKGKRVLAVLTIAYIIDLIIYVIRNNGLPFQYPAEKLNFHEVIIICIFIITILILITAIIIYIIENWNNNDYENI